MDLGYQTERFTVRYKESISEATLLWESHCHSFYELIAVLDGDVSVTVEGMAYRINACELAVVPPLSYHTVSLNQSGNYRRVTVLFDPASLPSALKNRFEKANRFTAPVKASHLESLAKIATADDQSFYLPLADSLMIQLLYEYVLYDGASVNEKSEDTLDETLHSVLNYIEAHLCDRLTLDAIAAVTARSKSSVCHLFKETMQVSVKQYILQKKLALASRMIREGVPPTVVATRIGYENYGNFYRMYRKHFGISPENEKRN